MKVIMYGAEICPDCVEAKEILSNKSDIELDYRNITKSTALLKEFLAYRDHEEIFASIKERGGIGIPLFILEDGTKTFEVTDFTNVDEFSSEGTASSCSLDGSKQC